MLNYLWGIMIVVGIAVGLITGNTAAISEATLVSSKEAIALCITMLGIMSFWCGLMEVAKREGVIAQMTRAMTPLLKFLFPRIPSGHPALESIATNMIANFLGLGWAATPAGLQAMRELAELEKSRPGTKIGVASREMCTFLIINISSLQLIPVNVIAYRSQYGSVNPSAIIVPAIVATVISTLTAVAFAKIMDHG